MRASDESLPCGAIVRKFMRCTPAQATGSMWTIGLFSGPQCPVSAEALKRDITDAVPPDLLLFRTHGLKN